MMEASCPHPAPAPRPWLARPPCPLTRSMCPRPRWLLPVAPCPPCTPSTSSRRTRTSCQGCMGGGASAWPGVRAGTRGVTPACCSPRPASCSTTTARPPQATAGQQATSQTPATAATLATGAIPATAVTATRGRGGTRQAGGTAGATPVTGRAWGLCGRVAAPPAIPATPGWASIMDILATGHSLSIAPHSNNILFMLLILAPALPHKLHRIKPRPIMRHPILASPIMPHPHCKPHPLHTPTHRSHDGQRFVMTKCTNSRPAKCPRRHGITLRRPQPLQPHLQPLLSPALPLSISCLAPAPPPALAPRMPQIPHSTGQTPPTAPPRSTARPSLTPSGRRRRARGAGLAAAGLAVAGLARMMTSTVRSSTKHPCASPKVQRRKR
jgi:hypothetical protein